MCATDIRCTQLFASLQGRSHEQCTFRNTNCHTPHKYVIHTEDEDTSFQQSCMSERKAIQSSGRGWREYCLHWCEGGGMNPVCSSSVPGDLKCAASTASTGAKCS
eukprot:1949890-Pleurochrysis_carterae.AAC.1